jgi:hypothetical protein
MNRAGFPAAVDAQSGGILLEIRQNQGVERDACSMTVGIGRIPVMLARSARVARSLLSY